MTTRDVRESLGGVSVSEDSRNVQIERLPAPEHDDTSATEEPPLSTVEHVLWSRKKDETILKINMAARQKLVEIVGSPKLWKQLHDHHSRPKAVWEEVAKQMIRGLAYWYQEVN